MQKPPSALNPHRLARLIVWAQATLVWTAAVLFGEIVAGRRRIRRRYGLLSLGKLTLVVRNLMIARAGEMLAGRARRRPYRHQPPSGFRHRMRARSPLRSIAGSRLRRFLREGGAASRLARFTHVLGHLDAYVRAFLSRRAKNGVNRLLAIIPARPRRDLVRTLARPTTSCADTS